MCIQERERKGGIKRSTTTSVQPTMPREREKRERKREREREREAALLVCNTRRVYFRYDADALWQVLVQASV